LAIKANVANREDIKQQFAAAFKTFGRLDALFNNAGIVGEARSILDADDAHLTDVFRTNVLSYFFCASEDSFTFAQAKELAPHGIRVNAVRPGLINTTIHEAHGGQALIDKIGPTVPLGRAGTADEVAEVVAFLAGPLSSYVHGTLVDVSGGR
jgi:NAD(P)-dependent dehydrogenase (short-subunit alcohol dehydrogenase family)